MPVILYHGDNILALTEAVRALRDRFNPADILTFDGVTVAPAALSEACLTPGLFDAERLVVAENFDQRYKGGRKDGEAAAMAEIIRSVAPTATLLIVASEMSSDHPLLRDVRDAGGDIRSFTTPKGQELPRWVIERGRARGVTIDRDAADLLAELVGSNPVMLDSEIEKLATYAGDQTRVTPDMVDLLVGAVPQQSIFALVDAVAAGDLAQALRLLHAQLGAATSTPVDVALYLIRMLARQMRILLRVKLAQRAGKSNPQIVAELKLNRYFAERYFRQARRFSRERMAASFERLAAFEYALKSGQADAATGLDLLVTELCG